MHARLLVAGVMAVCLTACPQKPVAYQATLYFADRDLRVLVPVTRPLETPPARLPAAMVASLQVPPEGLTSVLPTGTQITDVSRTADTVSVTLAPPQGGLQGAALVQEALALTLVGTDGITQVRLTGLPKGEGELDFSQPTGRPAHPNRWLDANEAEGTWITVAWQTPDHRYLVPVSVPAASDSAAARLAVWQAGPTGSRKTLLQGLWPSDRPIAIAEEANRSVSLALPQPLPSVDWPPTLRALGWTMTEQAGIGHVTLTGATLPPGIPADGRLARPPALNPVTPPEPRH